MKRLPYNHMSFRHKLQSSLRLLARAKKQGYGNMWRVWLANQPTLYLGPTKQLDGLSLYRQAVAKLEVPSVVYDDRGRTIMLVSHCH
jgi:hypothetical protein